MKPYKSFPIDSSAILFLSQMKPDHTNVYRFTAEMSETVDVQHLQQAVNRVFPRFPTIFAGIHRGKRFFSVVPVSQPIQVREDPGLTLVMTQEELEACAYRVFYSGSQISIELFHSLTDGYGALASLKAILGEYVYLKYGIHAQERAPLLESPSDWQEEARDSYLDHCCATPKSLPQGYAYPLPRREGGSQVRTTIRYVSAQALRDTARQYRVSVTSMLSELMAEAIMEHQNRHSSQTRKKPVRIMVPIDLRRVFPSRTLRNFVLYSLPTLHHKDLSLPRQERFLRFQHQLKQQFEKDFLKGQIARNVRIQNNFLFRAMPLRWKCALTLLSNRLFGETNSSITFTNLGGLPLSDGLKPYISSIQVHVMPRRRSPYNCGLVTVGDVTCITITRFDEKDELEGLFFGLLNQVLLTKQ